jgi:hypothetical protein
MLTMIVGKDGLAAEMAEQTVVGFHQDELGDWVAELACGHGQHVRHRPPWEMRPWVVTAKGRREHLGKVLRCVRCDETFWERGERWRWTYVE